MNLPAHQQSTNRPCLKSHMPTGSPPPIDQIQRLPGPQSSKTSEKWHPDQFLAISLLLHIVLVLLYRMRKQAIAGAIPIPQHRSASVGSAFRAAVDFLELQRVGISTIRGGMWCRKAPQSSNLGAPGRPKRSDFDSNSAQSWFGVAPFLLVSNVKIVSNCKMILTC